VPNAFNPSVSAELPGPAWLADLRREVAEGIDDVAPPSSDEEVWRYSRIGDLELDRFQPLVVQAPLVDPLAGPGATDVNAATLVLRNGWLEDSWISAEAAGLGVTAGPIGDLEDGAAHFASVLNVPVDLFGHLNRAFGPEPLAVVIPDGVRLDAPIVVRIHTDADSSALFPRLFVRGGVDSDVTIVEHHTSADVVSMVAPVLEALVEADARLSHALIQDLGTGVWQFAHQVFRVAQNATVETFVAGLGGCYARTRTDCRLVGRGAEAHLTAAYYGEGDQTHDFRTFQEHAAPDTTSELLFKGALDDTSRSVYSGLIRVDPEAVRTRAYQTNRNIKLSPDAWAQSVPNLEIETDDVVCSHASTVSPVDEDQLFYLESRGVPTTIAERLLVEGFFNDVVKRAPTEAVGLALRAALVERLDRRLRNFRPEAAA